MSREVTLIFDIFTHKIMVYRVETKIIDNVTGDVLYETIELYPKRQIARVAFIETEKIKGFLTANGLQVTEKTGNAANINIPSYLMYDGEEESEGAD